MRWESCATWSVSMENDLLVILSFPKSTSGGLLEESTEGRGLCLLTFLLQLKHCIFIIKIWMSERPIVFLF